MNIADIKLLLNSEECSSLNLNFSFCLKHNKIILKNLIVRYPQFKPKEILFLMKNKNNLNSLNIFCKCGNKNKFLNSNKGYSKYCCVQCANKDNTKNQKTIISKLNNIDEFGRNSFQRGVAKGKKTKFKKYGDENYNDRQKAERTTLKNFGVTNPLKIKEIHDKGIKKAASKEIRNKVVKTNLKKFGKEYYSQTKEWIKRYKNTNLDKYGVENISQLPNNREHISKILHSKQSNENRINSMIQKYGKENFTQTQQYKNLFKDKERTKKIQQKSYETKKKNGTLGTSNLEVECFNLIKKYFKDAVHHYKDSVRYPFNCDIYIPSQDLFIELNFFWTHGKEPFNENNLEHINIVREWQNKNNKYFDSAIQSWTKSDPLKLQTFKKNNLNYKIFYNKNDFYNWLFCTTIKK